jgi:5-methylcytosine-specific restriction endonuclease McrA
MQPVCIISWQKAICLLFQGKCSVIENYSDEVRSQKQVFKVPCVIKLNKKIKRKPSLIKFSKRNVFLRDKSRCCYCGKKIKLEEATYDHIHPKSKWDKTNGHATKWENVVISCKPCNVKKADKHIHECGHKLLNRPYKPTSKDIPLALVSIQERDLKRGPEVWKYYTENLRKAYGWID